MPRRQTSIRTRTPKGEAQHDADHQSAREQAADRGFGDPAVDDQRDARRNQQRGFRRRHDQAEAEGVAEAGRSAARIHQPAQRGDRRRRRAAHRAERHARADRAIGRRRRGQPAEAGVGRAAEKIGDPAFRHELGREDEERDRQQHAVVDAGDHLLDQHDVGHVAVVGLLDQQSSEPRARETSRSRGTA